MPLTEIPGFVPDSTARHWRASLFLGLASPQNGCTNPRINSRAARVSVKILCNSSAATQQLVESCCCAGRHARGKNYLGIVVSSSSRWCLSARARMRRLWALMKASPWRSLVCAICAAVFVCRQSLPTRLPVRRAAVKKSRNPFYGKSLVAFQRTAEVAATAQVGSDVCKTSALSPFQDTGEPLLNVVNLGLGFARGAAWQWFCHWPGAGVKSVA
jgi:hypothetical protein